MSEKFYIKDGIWYLATMWTTNKDEACVIPNPQLCELLLDFISQTTCSPRLKVVTADHGMKETEYFSYPRTKLYDAPHIVNDYKSSIYLDCLNAGDILDGFCSIDWLVVDKRFIKDRNVVQVTFMPNVIDNTLVPWSIPKMENGHILDPRASYDGSFVASLCDNLYKVIESRVKEDKQVSLISDLETTYFVHLPTLTQIRGGYPYFSIKENRVCRNANGDAIPYWTATPSTYGEVWCVDAVGNSYSGHINNSRDLLGFRPAFTLEFPDSRKKEETT